MDSEGGSTVNRGGRGWGRRMRRAARRGAAALDRLSTRQRALAAGVVILILLVPWAAWLSCGFRGCPDVGALEAYQPGGAPVLLDRHGGPFAELHPLELRILPLDSMPGHLPEAFIAVEDRRFQRHAGVDWIRVLGAAAANLRAGAVRAGASTLTMQLARTLFPDRVTGTERTLRRKLLEIRVAGRIEGRYSKREILELYLNHVYVGGGAYGVDAGARHYFGRPASELAPEEAALLAAVVRAPAHYDPRRHPERARQRRDLVLGLMGRQGRLPTDEHAAALERPLGVAANLPAREAPSLAPYFAESVRRGLEDTFGEDLYRSRLTVHTTLDPTLQRIAEEELLRQIEAVERGEHGPFEGWPEDPAAGGSGRPEGPAGSRHLQGVVVILDVASGDVLALVGGRDFHASRFDRATRARRQMGSAFKPFVYAAALQEGYVASQLVADRPLTLSQPGSGPWSPGNHDGGFRGPVPMRRALVESLNVPTVRLALAAGLDAVAGSAREAGLREPRPRVPAVALGAADATPLELAAAYAGLAGGGIRPVPRSSIRIEDARGRVVDRTPVHLRGGLEPRVAHLVTHLLGDVVDRGTGHGVRAAGFSGPAAGKTGTTQDAHDAWFVGYTPELAAVVWIGFDRPRPILPGATGGALAAPVWGRIMARIHEGREPPAPWERPAGIVERPVDPATGKVLGPGCPSPRDGAVRELFLEEFVPEAACPPSQENPLRRLVGFFRGLGGEDDEEDAPDHGGAPEVLTPDAPPARLLGTEPLPLQGAGGEGGRSR